MNKLPMISYLYALVELWNIADKDKKQDIEYYLRKMDSSKNYYKILDLFYNQFSYDYKDGKYYNKNYLCK